MEGFALIGRLLEMQQGLLAPDVTHERAMAIVCANAAALTGASGAAFESHDAVADEMLYREAVGTLGAFVGMRIARQGSLSGLALESQQVLVCDDSEADPRVDRAACQRVGARSMVVVPLVANVELVGVLKVVSAQPSAFAAPAVDLLRLLAGFLAVAVARAAAADERAAMDRYRDEMAALVAHDLKSPLTSVVANVEYMREELPPTHSDALEAASDALMAATRLSTMIGTMRDVSKLEQLPPAIEPRSFELRSVVEPVISDRRRFAASEQLTISNAVDDAAILYGDPAVFQRVVENLVDDAIRRTPRGGEIEVSSVAQGDWIDLRAGTTGPATAGAHRDPLAAVGSAPRADLGLGLHFCRLAAQAHGGRIFVDSDPRHPVVLVVSVPVRGRRSWQPPARD